MRNRFSVFLAAFALASMLLCGCGSGTGTGVVSVTPNSDGTVTVVLKPPTQVGGQTASHRPPPPSSPNTGSSQSTPNLGSGGPAAPANPPPTVSIKPAPLPGFSLDSNTQAIVSKFHLNLVGADATADNVAKVTNAAQLYQPRQHTLTVVIQRDSSKLPVAGVWYQTLGGAKIELYQPQMQHVSTHEFAHDLTLLVNPAAGDRLGQAIEQNASNPATWPSAYSHSNRWEAEAEVTSFWAEKASSLVPSATSFVPPAAVSQAVKPILADSLRNK